ncbi:MAG TPA: metallophosphoesterase, partial [Candidatus Thermoplasmatota archaeon]|nr:metallophosphoesterase [Candidatus Thermoplasmatota archaeon]
SLLQDEVVGAVGQVNNKGEMMFLESLIRPDIPRPDGQEKRGADVPLMAAFVSDVHVGSKTHLQENWRRMLRWLCGHGDSKRERDAAGRVKYLVIPGDLVDGVGIYPGQQHELSIVDIYDQYGAFAADLENVPEHIEIVVQPGNHDASRPAEPQPAFSKEVRARFDSRSARFVANPAWFRMHGALTLGYHGFSLIDFASSIPGLDYEHPLPTMKQMLQCRHLAPLYGERTPVAPEHKDYLVVNEVPDIFVTGHVHVPGIEPYRGVLMVNSGTWQSQTAYQKMLNFTPQPAKMPIIDLQTLRGTLVDFQTPATAGALAVQASHA